MTDFCKTAAAPWHEGQDQSVFESGSSKSLCSFFCSVSDVFLLLLKQNKSAMWAYVCISKVQISDKHVFQFFIAIPMISTESKRPSVFLHSWCRLGSSRHIGLGAGYVSGTRWHDLKDNLCLIFHPELLHVCQKEEVSQQASLDTQMWTSLLLSLCLWKQVTE